MIDASPTRMDIVYIILKQIVAIADSLELDILVLVMEQTLYSKADHIRWQNYEFNDWLFSYGTSTQL